MQTLIAARGPTVAPVANVGRDFSRNPAACVHLPGAVFHEGGTRVRVPPVGPRGTLGRVARSTEHGEVADVEWRATCCDGHDVINGEVARRMGVAPVTRAPVPVLATPCPEHPRTEALPRPCAVDGVVAAAVRLPSVCGAATAGAARDDTADGAQLHGSARSGADTVAARLTLVTLDCGALAITKSVAEAAAGVYPSGVLRLRDQAVVGSRAERLRGRASFAHAARRGQAHSPEHGRTPFSVLALGPKRGPSRRDERA